MTLAGDLLDPQYAKHYRELYQRHWWWRAREEALLRLLRRNLDLHRELRILDVGCGDGLFFDRLAQFGEVEGIEPDARLVDTTSPRSARIHIAPLDRNFRPAKKYDLLLLLDVLEHLDDPREGLECAHALLQTGGMMVLTVPSFQILWTNHDVINHHRMRYRRRTLFPLLRSAGFLISESRYWFQWTVPVKLGIGAFERLWSSQPSLPRIPPHWINRLLFHFSRLELESLGRCSLPVGSTLMVRCVRG